MFFLKRRPHIPNSYKLTQLCSLLEKGDKEEIEALLWQPKTSLIKYLPATFSMMLRLKKPEFSPEKLLIYNTESNKQFSLLILHLPWEKNKSGFSPLIIDNVSAKIAGVMLPFNELLQVLSKRQIQRISELGMVWIKFINERGFLEGQ